MQIEPKIEMAAERKIIGVKRIISFTAYDVQALWREFMPKKKEIMSLKSNDLISIAIYRQNFFQEFNPKDTFEKWAAAEVNEFGHIPQGMEKIIIPTGLYAIFNYQGLNTDHRIYDDIFRNWIPNSKYDLDDRPHFEVLGEKYKNNDPDSEEDIWIPIKLKS